jgi:hypothetical protein
MGFGRNCRGRKLGLAKSGVNWTMQRLAIFNMFCFSCALLLSGCALTGGTFTEVAILETNPDASLAYGMSEKEVNSILRKDSILDCWFRVGGDNYHLKSYYFAFQDMQKHTVYSVLEYEALFHRDQLVSFAEKRDGCACVDELCYREKLRSLLDLAPTGEEQSRHIKQLQEESTIPRSSGGPHDPGSLVVEGILTLPLALIWGIDAMSSGGVAYIEPASCAHDWIDGKEKAGLLTLGASYQETKELIISWQVKYDERDDGVKKIILYSKNGCPHLVLTFGADELLSIVLVRYT